MERNNDKWFYIMIIIGIICMTITQIVKLVV